MELFCFRRDDFFLVLLCLISFLFVEGAAIASLSSANLPETTNGLAFDRGILVRAARQLLSSVTRVLLLADRVVVKQILKAEDKVNFVLRRWRKFFYCFYF